MKEPYCILEQHSEVTTIDIFLDGGGGGCDNPSLLITCFTQQAVNSVQLTCNLHLDCCDG